jgi:AraC-like DNA-binding protein
MKLYAIIILGEKMKVYQSQLLCMGGKEITIDMCEGLVDNVYPNGKKYGYHDFFEFEFFEKGEGFYLLNGTPYEVKSGFSYLLAPGDYHRAQMREKTEYRLWNLKISENVFSDRIKRKLKEFSHPYYAYLDQEMSEFILAELQFLQSCLVKKRFFDMMAENSAERICAVLLSQIIKTPLPLNSSNGKTVNRIEEYVKKNFQKTITLKEIAKEMQLSENYVGVYFKKCTGMRFVEYLNQVRLFHAIELLKATPLSIKEISYRVGFCSPEYLTRIFKAYFNCSPTQMRKDLAKRRDF